MRTIKRLTSLTWAPLLIVLSMPVASTQDGKPPEDSVAKIRQLMQEISRHYKAEAPIEEQPEEVRRLVFKVFEMFRKKTDTAAAIVLLKGSYEYGEEALGGNVDPRLQSFAWVVDLIYSDPRLKENFLISLLPLLEREDDPDLAKMAVNEIVWHYFSPGGFGGIERWLTQQLKEGRLPPQLLIKRMFDYNPEHALYKLLNIYQQLGSELSNRGSIYLTFFTGSVRYAKTIDNARGNLMDKDDELSRELRRAGQFAWETARRSLVQAWQACPQWYVRRYLAHYVHSEPINLKTPEILKLMMEENHPLVRPIIERPED